MIPIEATRQLILYMLATFFLLVTGLAQAEVYPSKPIQLIVPFPPGGDTERVARNFAPLLSKHLGKAKVELVFNTDNAGQAAIQALKLAKPDGYTLMLGGIFNLVISPSLDSKLEPEWQNLQPIAIIDLQPLLCVTGFNSEYKTHLDLIERIRSGKKLRLGATGLHSAMFPIFFFRTLGFKHDSADLTLYPRSVDVFNAIVQNQVDFVCAGISTLQPFIAEKKMRPLFTNSLTELTAYPQLASPVTMKLRNLNRFQIWTSLVAPKNLPPNIAKQLRNALLKIDVDPEWKSKDFLTYGQSGINKIENPLAFMREEAAFFENLAILSRLLK